MVIIYSMFALVLLTFLVGLCLGISRVLSVKKGHVDQHYYHLMAGYEVPEYTVKLSRNFSNLFELPILFYIVGLLIVTLGIENTLLNILAWMFVGLRFGHTYIHVTYNNLKHRSISFGLSVLVLFAMWLQLICLIS